MRQVNYQNNFFVFILTFSYGYAMFLKIATRITVTGKDKSYELSKSYYKRV